MRFFREILLKIAIILFSASYLFAQRESNYQAEISTVLGTEQTPFWMRANQYGMVPNKAQTAVLSVGTISDYQKTKKKINWGYGLNVGAFVGMQNKAIIQEAYFKAKWKSLEFYAGRRKEIQGLVDTTLSSGSYIWSGNALPMPKIQISIPEYTSIGGEGLISIKGNYAHGWFDRNRSDAKGVFLHQKSGYVRIGKPNYKFKFYTGFNHQAQWGGKILFPDPNGIYSKNGRFGSSFRDYLYIVSGKSAVGTDTSKLTGANEALNRVGNHLGSFDISFEVNLSNLNLLLYRQNIYEDGSLFYLNNISDGLNGISITFKENKIKNFALNKLTFEFFNTLNQGGIFNGDNPLAPSSRGFDNYFNNTQFRDGWSFKKTSIGTPFILSQFEFPKRIFKPNDLLFTNNRVQAYYLGFSGKVFNEYEFTSKISFSKNWGMFGMDFPKLINQTSIILLVKKPFPTILGGINAFVSFASDFGELLEQNSAIQIGIKKSWNTFPFNPHPTHRHRIKPQI
jgi:Capsule assembly protein Wzi